MGAARQTEARSSLLHTALPDRNDVFRLNPNLFLQVKGQRREKKKAVDGRWQEAQQEEEMSPTYLEVDGRGAKVGIRWPNRYRQCMDPL